MITANAVLARWNLVDEDAAVAEVLPCCGSRSWALELARARPFADDAELCERSDRIWLRLALADWDEAFRTHPRIGERKAVGTATQQSAAWSRDEQSGAGRSDASVLGALERGNRLYEERFGRVFLVCATGKSAAEILTILERRLQNDSDTELQEAVEQQRQITQLRLRKWLGA